MERFKHTFLFLGLLTLLFGYQNCGDVKFKVDEKTSSPELVVNTNGMDGEEITDDSADDIEDEVRRRGDDGDVIVAAEGAPDCDRGDGSHVYICHFPPGNPENYHTICVGAPAVRAHTNHHRNVEGAQQDLVGRCEDLDL